MQPMDANKCLSVFIGEQSILISCAEVWLYAGHSIDAVVSDNLTIRDWCREHNIKWLSWDPDTEQQLLTHSYDYLFSLANLRILPDNIITAAKVAAINFHDGPLPDYSGVNTPTWAIINGESNHAISFHRMTSTVDQGEVLIHKSFPLLPDATSLTANATCFELALEAFKELVEHPPAQTQKTVSRTATSRRVHHYRKSDRPALAGLLNWNESAAQVDSLVRALDFGNYENPMCTAKIWNGKSILNVAKSKVTEQTLSIGKPGTIVDISDQTITVCCKDGNIALSDFSDYLGKPMSGEALKNYAENTLNSVFPALTTLSKTDQEIIRLAAANDSYWKQKLASTSLLDVPYLSEYNSGSVENGYQILRQTVPNFKSQSLTFAIVVAYLARLNDRSQFDIGLFEPFSSESLVQHLVQNLLTSTLSLGTDDTPKTLSDKLNHCRIKVTNTGGCLRDLPLRQPGTTHWPNHKVTFQLSSDLNEPVQPVFLSSDLHLSISADGQFVYWAQCNSPQLADATEIMREQLSAIFARTGVYDTPVNRLNILTDNDLNNIHNVWNQTDVAYPELPVHEFFENSVIAHADKTALTFEATSISYSELNIRANRLANWLIADGLQPRQNIGVLMDRSIEMVIALLAVLKSGGAYVPLDPTYPVARLNHMVSDAGLALILCDEHLINFLATDDVPMHIINDASCGRDETISNPDLPVSSNDLAYLIYTSGSTGMPKGVMVEHRNVANFFAAMDEKIKPPYETWLAVTSISFDISVLEIFWTLARGFKVVLYSDDRRQKSYTKTASKYPDKGIDLSLFYWNVAEEDSLNRDNKYRLLLEGAKFADNNGFAAVWNPERHFAAFGGSFPNPAVTCAAIAATTKNIHIRAGSCVAPLHSPIRIAEDWSVIDNLSNGRVGVAFAAGWAPPDFAILPDNHKNAKEIMFAHLDKVKRLWRGETLDFEGPTGPVPVRTLPRPIQKELPVWITTAGNIESYHSAGTLGANILTHLLGQTLEDVSEKAAAYHEAWKSAGHAGTGKITLMLHTFVGENKDAVRTIVHKPMKQYLKSAMFLVKAAAWNFPTFKKLSKESGTTIDSYFDTLTDEDLDAILDFAFDRYFESSGLFGSVDDAVQMIDKCKLFGIHEIACLIDFGVDDQIVLDHLPYLAQLRQSACDLPAVVNDIERESKSDYSISALIKQHDVSHVQCTPSMATLLLSDEDTKSSLRNIQQLLVGGESLPDQLAKELIDAVAGSVTNMYGPTETTIWSSTSEIDDQTDKVSIGQPIGNTQMYIVDSNTQLLPQCVSGELLIGGDGVVRGYHNNKPLTEERFIKNPFSNEPDARLYRTGDLAMYLPDGTISCLGRTDHQVKMHGYRIELGEIESALCKHEAVMQAAVIVREDTTNDRRIVAYLVIGNGFKLDPESTRYKLKETLPDFMLPSAFVELQTMPLTPNGKIDRTALPKPDANKRASDKKIVAPINAIETTIADCWKQTLGVDAVGRNDNFFDIGGNSILLLDVLARLNKHKEIQQTIKITDVFRFSTVESLAAFLANSDIQESSTAGVARASSRRAAMNRRRRSVNHSQNRVAP